jgi:hypothetical protein
MRFVKPLAWGLVALVMTGTARADPVLVTSGTMLIGDPEGDLLFLRGAGFSITSVTPPFEHFPKTFPDSCFRCRAGDAFDFSFTTDGEQFVGSGPATFAGTFHAELFYRAELTAIATGQRFPDTTDSVVEIVQPFVFNGLIRAFTDPEFSSLAFATALRGRGRAHTRFFREDLRGVGVYIPEEAAYIYEFEPIPEPATLLMVGVGIAGLGLRRGRLKKRSALMDSSA